MRELYTSAKYLINQKKWTITLEVIPSPNLEYRIVYIQTYTYVYCFTHECMFCHTCLVALECKIFVFDRVVCGMASANVPVENPFLTRIERVRVELRERARARQVLQERETALLSELQRLEDTYMGEGVAEQIPEFRRLSKQAVLSLQRIAMQEVHKQIITQLDARMRELEASLETAGDRMKQVEVEFTLEIKIVLDMIQLIQVREVPNSSQLTNPVLADGESIQRGLLDGENQANPSFKCKTSNDSLDINKTIITSHPQSHPITQHALKHTEGKLNHDLRNIENTCYMNCILQCLSHTSPLRQFYVSDDHRQYLNNRGDLSTAFKDAMINLSNTTSEYSVDPYGLKREVKEKTDIFSDNRQHDAHEFMRFLLNELHEEINRASEEGRKSPADNETLEEACARYLSWEDSRISQLFSGMLRSDVCCSVCNNQSTAYIPFMDLSLPIRKQRSKLFLCISSDLNVQLADCLRMFLTKETLDKEERPYCNKCNQLRTSTKQLIMAKLPTLLVIQLKRFSGVNGCSKRSTHVEFDDTLTLRLEDKISTITYTYSLYGVVCHSGSLTGGHYTAYCKYKRNWSSFTDAITKSVSWEQVRQQEAYILFYEENSIL